MSRRRHSRFQGLLMVAKKAGPTSHDVVDMARKALRERRVGHTGTLDPMAEGLLMLCVGQATRLQQYLLSWDKTYRGIVQLGHATTTYDREGEVTEPQGEVPAVDRATLDDLVASFSGDIEQLPPPYSAKKVAGKKLYELARKGETVEVEPKQVTVHQLQLSLDGPTRISVEVRTSSGFYVRTFAHDVGLRLGCGGFLDHLERIQIGPYAITDALAQEQLEAAATPEEILESASWIPLEGIQLPFAEITLNPAAAERFKHGQEVVVFRAAGGPLAMDDKVTVHLQNDRLLGIGTVTNVLARGRTASVKPTMVLANEPSWHAASK